MKEYEHTSSICPSCLVVLKKKKKNRCRFLLCEFLKQSQRQLSEYFLDACNSFHAWRHNRGLSLISQMSGGWELSGRQWLLSFFPSPFISLPLPFSPFLFSSPYPAFFFFYFEHPVSSFLLWLLCLVSFHSPISHSFPSPFFFFLTHHLLSHCLI